METNYANSAIIMAIPAVVGVVRMAVSVMFSPPF